ncbi:MAG: hypothetical protein AABZ31_06505 [Bdellovibrionota bacterium]
MRVTKSLILSWILSATITGYGAAAMSEQTLSLGVFQSQYVTDSSASSNANQTSSFIPNFKMSESVFKDKVRAEGDMSAIVPMQQGGEFHVWFPSLNLQFGDRLRSSTTKRQTQVTFGRAIKSWSRLDTEWGLGLWQPQFRFDYIRPKQMGLTGLFYETEKELLKFTAFASGLYLPDQQGEFDVTDGKFVSKNRWFRPPVTQLEIEKGTSDIYYELDKPSVSSVIWNPSYGIALRAGEEESGPWIQFAMADKPANQLHIGIEPEDALKLSDDKKVHPIIHPQLVRHRLLTAEAGYQGSTTNFYASVTGESFEDPKLPEMWKETPLEDSIYYGIGGSQLTEVLGFKTVIYSGLVFKDVVGDNEPAGMGEELSTSIQKVAFERLFNVGIRYPMHPKVFTKWATDLKYTYSMSDRAEWLMAQVSYAPKKDWSFYLGADVLGAPDKVESDKLSFISKYRDNDRIEGGFTHVF